MQGHSVVFEICSGLAGPNEDWDLCVVSILFGIPRYFVDPSLSALLSRGFLPLRVCFLMMLVMVMAGLKCRSLPVFHILLFASVMWDSPLNAINMFYYIG